MSALRRKLLRDLWHLRGHVAAIGVVVACGVATVVTSRTAYESLAASQARYYAEYRFADVFASLVRAPDVTTAALATLRGVAAVSPRVVFDVTLDVPGLGEPAVGRLVSIPARARPILNDLHLRRGRWVAPGARDEALVSEAFATANRLDLGDTVGAILNGRWASLRIVGIALSPEFIYEIRGADLFPDNRHFGVFWMARESMGSAFDMDGAFNDVALSLTAGANAASVVAGVDRILAPFGGRGAYGRSEHVSHQFISDEIRQNRVFGTVLPAIFLGVAAFLLNIVLSRLVATQREQIGALKAFGYGRRTVSAHYLQFALVAVALGALAGTGGGLWLAAGINRMYQTVYRFPVLRFAPGGTVIGLALAASAAAALLGALGAVRRAWAVPPAEAMRPEPPAMFQAGRMEHLGLRRLRSPSARMIVRHLARQPTRALLATIGLALAVGVLVLGRYFVDAIDHLAVVQFRLVQREDVTIVAHDPLPAAARDALARLTGVLRAEPFRTVPVRLRGGHHHRRAALIGLDSAAGMRRLIGRDLRAAPLPPDGVVLTAKLAEVLGVAPGDTVSVEMLEGRRAVRAVPVRALVDELLGLSAYMDLRALNRLLGEGRTISGAFLHTDAAATADLFPRLRRLPAIGAVSLREAALRSFERTLGESLGIFTAVLVFFAGAIAVAVVYNAARIALSERGRDLASLRVLGFTRREVAVMLLGEQAVLIVAALPVGVAFGYGASAALAAAYQWELFRLPLVLTRRTLAFTLLVIGGAALLSAAAVRRRIDRLDLVAVLKTRE